MKKLNLMITYTLGLSAMIVGCNSGGLPTQTSNAKSQTLKVGGNGGDYMEVDYFKYVERKIMSATYNNLNQQINYVELTKFLLRSQEFTNYVNKPDGFIFKLYIYSNGIQVVFSSKNFFEPQVPVSIAIDQYSLQIILGYDVQNPQQIQDSISSGIASYAHNFKQSGAQQSISSTSASQPSTFNPQTSLKPTNADLMERNIDLTIQDGSYNGMPSSYPSSNDYRDQRQIYTYGAFGGGR